MAFFGITTLGPPNVFELYRHGEISAVSKEDFFSSFRMIAGGTGKVNHEQIKDVLFEAMGGVKPEREAEEEFLAYFTGNDMVDIEQFEDALDEYNRKQSFRPAKQYVSSAKLREDKIKHKRADGDTFQKYHAPLTAMQEYGWGSAPANIRAAAPPSGRMFYHRPSHMSYYAECMACFEEGRDMCAGPTMKAMEM
ncbi:hypothetical protein T484DRAFT_2884428 [Baffinella frigidus]|nr:hypothetical protein T484DRAFT_2884428 [Cryptophyta sp. CCMP2293]|mmetsp:Transcript_47934/g.114109  ORF Transcript_47934/g.114109 Transcript_47934/m.114109 type:complete len:194 (-) Transcript_47934:92-673(-)